MKPDIKIEHADKVAFKVKVREYPTFAIVSIVFDQRYEYFASIYGVCSDSNDDLTLGIFPENYDELSEEKQQAWDDAMPVVRVNFCRKYVRWTFNANEKETNSFLVVTPESVLVKPLFEAYT